MSHDLGEVVCRIGCNFMILFADTLFIDIRMRDTEDKK